MRTTDVGAREKANERRSTGAGRDGAPDVWGGRGKRLAWGNRSTVVVLAVSLSLLPLAAPGCSSSPCGDCPGGTISPAYDVYDRSALTEAVRWELDLDGGQYTVTCDDSNRQIETADGELITCEAGDVHISWDVSHMRIRAAERSGRWETEGWYEVSPDLGTSCGCTPFFVRVPIVYRRRAL